MTRNPEAFCSKLIGRCMSWLPSTATRDCNSVVMTMMLCLWFAECACGQQAASIVNVKHSETQVVIHVDQQPVAVYVFQDSSIPRPYFAHVKAPGGIQVTRRHPPVKDQDLTDHATMHPGIWLAFGDLQGTDFWRNKGRVTHVQFLQKPEVIDGTATFAERKHYLTAEGDIICEELFRCAFEVRPEGYLLTWDSTFTSSKPFSFGDQEEMGLGMRVATPLSEVNGGRLMDSTGRATAQNIWSLAADWCDYSGQINQQPVGMTLMCHPENFRPSWLHARNYGFVAANPFGRKAMQKGDVSSVTVKPENSLRLRYAVWIHSGNGGSFQSIQSVFESYGRP